MQARLCATVTGATTEEIRSRRDAAAGADLVELRLDYAHSIDVAGVLADRLRPVVVTCRPKQAGGRFEGSEEERYRLLAEALARGADYVDVEWCAGSDFLLAAEHGRRIVLSIHDFDRVPADLEARYRAMRATGAEVVKIAMQVDRLADLVRLRDLDRDAPGGGSQRVIIGMGPAGVPSRVLPDRFGSAWTYAGEGVAPGQIGLERMVTEFRVRDLGSDARLYGVLGSPLAHSLSPAMHNAGFAQLGLDAVYLPLQASDVEDFEIFARAFDVAGASVTAPCKEAAMTLVADPDTLCRRAGAVNTLRAAGDRWEGRNTDIPGFLDALCAEHGRDLSGWRAVILGAGGAARGVAVALVQAGAEVTVCARRREQAREVASLAEVASAAWPPSPGSWDLLVNTTPVGTAPAADASPLPAAALDGGIVCDLVYNPRVTRLLADAARRGCRTIGGLGMLVAQAERQFAWWTGVQPAPGLFRAAAERGLEALGTA